MSAKARYILSDALVRDRLGQAWKDSQPGLAGGHEEGGFILRDSNGNLRVERWPRGQQDSIAVPDHRNCQISDQEIVATFHTHPKERGRNNFLNYASQLQATFARSQIPKTSK